MALVDPKLPTSLGPSRGPRFFHNLVVVRRRLALLAALAACALPGVLPRAQDLARQAETVADLARAQDLAREAGNVSGGVRLHRLADPSLLSPPGPVAVQLLELDPGRVTLELALAHDRSPAKETVVDIVRRRKALAGVNAGFFVVATGAPAGVLKVGGRVVGTNTRPRGAVGIRPRTGGKPVRLLFDQLALVRHPRDDGKWAAHPRLGTSPKDWGRVPFIVGGAGLLRRAGKDLRPVDWVPEKMRDGFTTERHPRTVIGTTPRGAIWLITVDGRNPAISLGMTFAELQRLVDRVGLRDALNLDGGGSTTMVVRGEVVNHPSDPTGPRPVRDALAVFPR